MGRPFLLALDVAVAAILYQSAGCSGTSAAGAGDAAVASSDSGADVVADAAMDTDGASYGPTCKTIRASDYEQSCNADSDCVLVMETDACCAGAAINASVQAQYARDLLNSGCPAKVCTADCSLPVVCCSSGICQVEGPLACPSHAADAGADAIAGDAATDTGPDAADARAE